jgi:peptidoglycan/LPS O-acetylase OafA/YrhL
MFGTWRLLLSCMVVSSHTWFLIFDGLSWLGTYAVCGFYVLSGFLMTRVLHQTYGYGPRALLHFLLNRGLKIYPAYWAALALSAAIVVLGPRTPAPDTWVSWVADLKLPQSVTRWFIETTLVFLEHEQLSALLPPSWSLRVELWMYLALGLGLSRSLPRTLLWFVGSLAWTFHALQIDMPWELRFATVVGASLPFAAGSLLHWMPVLTTRARWGVLGIAAFVPWSLVPGIAGISPTERWFYAAMCLAVGVTALLRDVEASPRARRIDSVLGDLAYPVFLIHIPVIHLLLWFFPTSFAMPRDWFFVSLPLVLVSAWLFRLAVVVPVEKARSRIRAEARSA